MFFDSVIDYFLYNPTRIIKIKKVLVIGSTAHVNPASLSLTTVSSG